ncbi:MAG: carboxypeptidase regulatory-like domain-containing protein [Janthinobacterium lividum]
MSLRRFASISSAAAVFMMALAVVPFPARAQDMPAMQTDGEARFVCGGVGSDESTAMRAAMNSHPLALLFARADGAYLADVGVTVTDAGGKPALKTRARGPVCLVDLPAGKYTVEADVEGNLKKQTVTLGGKPATVDFRF